MLQALELNAAKIKPDYRCFLPFFFLVEGRNSQLKQLLPRVAADWQGCYYVIWFSCRKWDNCTIPLSERNTYLWAKCFLKITLYNPLDFITPIYLQLLINMNRARTLMRSFNEKLSANQTTASVQVCNNCSALKNKMPHLLTCPKYYTREGGGESMPQKTKIYQKS